MRRIRKIHVFALALVAALLVPAAGVSRGNGTSLLTKIGKGEGSLNLIEWPLLQRPELREASSRSRQAASSTARTPAPRTRWSR